MDEVNNFASVNFEHREKSQYFASDLGNIHRGGYIPRFQSRMF